MADHERKGRRVVELALAGEEVGVEPGEVFVGLGVQDLVQLHARMPGLRVRDFPIAEAEHLCREREHPLQDFLERQVFRDGGGVDPELLAALSEVVETPVPCADGAL